MPWAPDIDASLYWLAEDAVFSFTRVCQYLMSRGLTTADEIVGAPGASFITASQGRLKKTRAKSHTHPGRLEVYYSPISGEAAAHGDHPPIEISWADQAGQHPDESAKYLMLWGKREYRFFTDMCALLSPLYANLTGEGFVSCAYDMLHDKVCLRHGAFFCEDTLLGADAAAFWATYAYTERAGTGMYGTDYLPWSPRKWTAGRELVAIPRSSQETRNTLFLAALKRAYRDHRREVQYR